MQRNILIIDDHNDLAGALEEVFTHLGYSVRIVENRYDGLAAEQQENFDFTITDLDVDAPSRSLNLNGSRASCLPDFADLPIGDDVKIFKLCAANFRFDGPDHDELKNIVATVLDYKTRFIDNKEAANGLHEVIEFELPSVISLMHIVLEYLVKRVEKLGVVKAEHSNLYVALDEAFVNAVKHGNKYDSAKLVRVSADVTRKEARFTIEDEGEGFDVNAIPNPLDPENLFKTSGRGVLFIYNIMDEVRYNERGNRLTMVKKANEPVTDVKQ